MFIAQPPQAGLFSTGLRRAVIDAIVERGEAAMADIGEHEDVQMAPP
jgi:hypothetical protein